MEQDPTKCYILSVGKLVVCVNVPKSINTNNSSSSSSSSDCECTNVSFFKGETPKNIIMNASIYSYILNDPPLRGYVINRYTKELIGIDVDGTLRLPTEEEKELYSKVRF